MNHYEAVFILTPVLSDVQMKEAVEKFKSLLEQEGAEIVNVENWGQFDRRILDGIDRVSVCAVRMVCADRTVRCRR